MLIIVFLVLGNLLQVIGYSLIAFMKEPEKPTEFIARRKFRNKSQEKYDQWKKLQNIGHIITFFGFFSNLLGTIIPILN